MNQTPNKGANQSKHPPKPAPARALNARHWMGGDLKAYVDGELPTWRQRLTTWHVARCASCRREAAWMQQMDGQFADWENDHSPLPRPELRARILACLPAESPLHLAQRESVLTSRASYRPLPRLTLAFGSLTAIVLLMAGAFALNLRHSASAPAITNSPLPVNSMGSNVQNSVVAVAQAEKRPRVLSIFVAPKNSFDAAATRVSAASGTISPASASSETHSTPQEVSGATGNPSSPMPSDEAYTDPTSREAERLASQKIGEMLNARHQRSAANGKTAPRPPQPATPANVIVPKTTPQFALAVANVSEARQQLQQWAETSGAKLRVMPEKGNAPAVFTANGAALPSGTLVEMRVPVQFANSLQAHLSQMGTPLAPTGAITRKPRALLLVPETDTAVARAPILPSPPGFVASPANGIGNTFVTIRVRLLPGETPVQP